MKALESYSWPGNVRQLENACERAILLCEGTIEPEDLPPEVLSSTGPAGEHEDLSVKRRLPALEKELIGRALSRTGGNRTRAAKLLELSYKALLYKIRDYGLD